MSPEDLSARLRATFVQELEDQLRAMDTSLLALESRPGDGDAIRTLFRAAHSVKGAARVAGVPLVEEACHALETVFAQVRDGTRALDGSDFSLLFAITDALGDAARRLRADESLDDGSLPQLLPRVRAMHGEPGEVRRETGGAAPRADAPSRDEPRPHAPPRNEARRDASSRDRPPSAAAAPDVPSPDAEPVDSERAPADVGGESVRVSADRLDALAAHATDLLTTSGAVARRPVALEDLFADLMQWSAAWRRESTHGMDERLRGRHADLDRRLHQIAERAARIARAAQDEVRVLVRATNEILTGVRDLRMRRFADAVEALPRAARDVADATNKTVELVIEGEDVEADRIVIDTLREPLLHLVRNAVDHGIEPAAERRARGKPERGTVRVAAVLEQGRLQIVVEDDGRGIDTDAVQRRIAAQGEEAPQDRRSLARRLLAGGVTTKQEATSISGRGVGLDLVRAALDRIGGSIDLRWQEGEFTRFILDSPPSPATLRAIVVDAGGQLFALPIGQVERVVRVRAERVREVEGRPALMLGDAPVPIATLAGVMGPPLRETTDHAGAPALLLRSGTDALALIVDSLVDEREVVVRPLDRRAHVPHVSGGALLPSGRIALVLIARTLLEAGLGRDIAMPRFLTEEESAPAHHLLVVDDSITTRTLEESVLEAAGYRVTTAVDGQDAWEKLQARDVDLVVSDVEMPRMSGFELCRRMREAKAFAGLPVVLLTGLETAEDRSLGLEVGADAYLLKSSFDQSTLLETIRQLIG